jgi:L-amino acid N-acyltransferase YncA
MREACRLRRGCKLWLNLAFPRETRPMQIRDATLADLPRIVEIYNAAIPGRMATADTAPITVADRSQWFAEHNAMSRPLWVAIGQHGAIAGWLSFSSFYGRPAYHATAELSIYVAPEHQREGIACSLLERALLQAPQFGLKTLLGFIFAHNLPSVTLFERAGFAAWGRLPDVAELDGIERGLLILGLRIQP